MVEQIPICVSAGHVPYGPNTDKSEFLKKSSQKNIQLTRKSKSEQKLLQINPNPLKISSRFSGSDLNNVKDQRYFYGDGCSGCHGCGCSFLCTRS